MALGGDIVELTSSNPDLGTFVYRVQVGQDNTYDTGGYVTNDDANQKTGAGEAIWQLNGKMGALNVTVVNDMTRKVAERIRQEISSLKDTTYTFSVVNGISYRGTGRIVGDITPNVNNSTIPIKVAAPEFKQI